jgi:hypothetical protein
VFAMDGIALRGVGVGVVRSFMERVCVCASSVVAPFCGVCRLGVEGWWRVLCVDISFGRGVVGRSQVEDGAW